MTRVLFIAVLSVTLICCAGPARAVILGCVPSPDDRRLDAVGAMGYTNQLIGPSSFQSIGGSCTLVAPNMILLSAHQVSSLWGVQANPTLPAAGTRTVRFRRRPDGGVGQSGPACSGVMPQCFGAETHFHVKVDHFILAPWNDDPPSGQLPRADLAIGVLQCDVTHIEPIRIHYHHVDAFDNDAVIVAGWGQEESDACWFGGCPDDCPHDERFGVDRVRLKFATMVNDAVSTTQVNLPDACFWFNPCHCGPSIHDSGGPVLVASEDCPGKFELLAVLSSSTAAYHLAPLQGFVGSQAFPLPAGSPGNPCPGDANWDSSVNGLDLGVILAQWGSVPALLTCAGETGSYADLNCDGQVDGEDLGIMLAGWGDCPSAVNECQCLPLQGCAPCPPPVETCAVFATP